MIKQKTEQDNNDLVLTTTRIPRLVIKEAKKLSIELDIPYQEYWGHALSQYNEAIKKNMQLIKNNKDKDKDI